VYIAKAFANQAEFFAAVDHAASTLPPGISVTPALGTDWDGEPAVFFQIVLADNAGARAQLLALTKQISQGIVQQVQPLEEWGVLPYFDFKTQTDKAKMKEPAWT